MLLWTACLRCPKGKEVVGSLNKEGLRRMMMMKAYELMQHGLDNAGRIKRINDFLAGKEGAFGRTCRASISHIAHIAIY